jgi:phosphohistidine phosphatase
VRTLYLVRHAKSSWADPSLADQDRPLNKRGLRDAPVMAQRLVAGHQVRVDAIWTSPARRAVETARCFARVMKVPRKEIELHDRLYTSALDDLLLEVRSCPDGVKRLLVVGHNPVSTEFANFLIDCGRETVIGEIPTCGIVAIEFSCASWHQIRENEGRLLFFDYPKKDVPSV